MSSLLPPPLTASRDPFDSILQLICALATIATTVITYILESRLNPRPRIVISGESTQHRRASQAQRPTTTTATSDPFEPESGPAVQPEPVQSEALEQTRTPKRARACLSFIRLTIVAAVAASVAFASLDAVKYVTASAFSPLASRRTNEWMHAVMHRAVLAAGANMKTKDAVSLTSPRLRVGLGEQAIVPEDKTGGRFFWVAFMFIVGVVGILGAFLAVTAELLPVKRGIAFVIMAQGIFWLIAGLVAAFVGSTKLPVDSANLRNHWTDGIYESESRFINETRMLGNWFVSVPSDRTQSGEVIVPVVELPEIEEAFCEQFTDLLGKTGAEVPENDIDTGPPSTSPPTNTESTTTTTTTTTDEDSNPPPDDSPDRPTLPPSRRNVPLKLYSDISQRQGEETGHPNLPEPESVSVPELGHSNREEVFLVYLVGKPIGLDRHRILSYFGLAGLIGASVVAAQFLKKWYLYPFVLLWAVVWVAFTLLGTPTTLRVLSLPTDVRQLYRVCGTDYHVLVMDARTKSVARLDASIFGLVLLAAILHGFRWGYFAQKTAVEEDEREVKLVNYEDVFNQSGSLKW